MVSYAKLTCKQDFILERETFPNKKSMPREAFVKYGNDGLM